MRDRGLKHLVSSERSEEDLAFDPTIERKCDHQECQELGRYRPVLLLQPGRDYTGKPFRFPLGIVVCERHREKFAEAYLTDDLWGMILVGFKARGIALPHRSSTRLDFDPHGGSTVAAAVLAAPEGAVPPEVDAMNATAEYIEGTYRPEGAAPTREARRREMRALGMAQAEGRARKMLPQGGYRVVDKATDEDIDAGRFRCGIVFDPKPAPLGEPGDAALASAGEVTLPDKGPTGLLVTGRGPDEDGEEN